MLTNEIKMTSLIFATSYEFKTALWIVKLIINKLLTDCAVFVFFPSVSLSSKEVERHKRLQQELCMKTCLHRCYAAVIYIFQPSVSSDDTQTDI